MRRGARGELMTLISCLDGMKNDLIVSSKERNYTRQQRTIVIVTQKKRPREWYETLGDRFLAGHI